MPHPTTRPVAAVVAVCHCGGVAAPAGTVLLLHLALAMVALAAVAVARVVLGRGAHGTATARPPELAYLNGGPQLVVFTALTELRRRRKVGVHPLGGIVAYGPPDPADEASTLLTAVLRALRTPARGPDVLRDAAVAAAVTRLGERLVRRGWVLSTGRRRMMRRYGVPGWLAALWCATAFVLTLPDFTGPGRALQALGLLVLTAVVAVGTLHLVDVPPVTRAGRAVQRRARAAERARGELDGLHPSRVAVYGEPELYRADAFFAGPAGAFDGVLGPMPRLMTHGVI